MEMWNFVQQMLCKFNIISICFIWYFVFRIKPVEKFKYMIWSTFAKVISMQTTGYGCDLTKSGCKTSLDLTKHKHKLPPHVEDLSYINVKTLSFTCSSKALRLEHCIYPWDTITDRSYNHRLREFTEEICDNVKTCSWICILKVGTVTGTTKYMIKLS